jgi:hypothetical protein
MRLRARCPATGRPVETTTLARRPSRPERNTVRSPPTNRAARTGAAPGATIHAKYGSPGAARSSPRMRIAARPPLPTARTSPGDPLNAIRSVLGFASSARTRRSTSEAADPDRCPETTRAPSPGDASADAPAEITAAAPSTIAATPASTPRTASVSGEGRRPRGTSTAHMLAAAELVDPSSSNAVSCTAGMSGTIVTAQPSR